MSVTSELPVADLSSRRRRDHAAVIPFPRRPAPEPPEPDQGPDQGPSESARRSAKAAHPAGKGLVGRVRAAAPARPAPVRQQPVRAAAPPERLPEPVPVAPPELTVVPPAPVRPLHLVPAASPVVLPEQVRPEPRPVPAAPRQVAGPLRLTRRGRLLLTALGTLALAAIITFVAPAVAHLRSGPAVPSGAPAVVVVQPGDTLWGIARRVAPDRDARLVVADLRRLNALPTADVHPGQRLEIRRP